MKRLAVLIFTLWRLDCFAQDSLQELSLNECIELALKNNIDAGKKHINTQSAKLNLQQERANLLPSVNAGFTYGLNLGRSINPQTNTYVNEHISYANPYLGGSLLLFNGMAQQNSIKQYLYLYKATEQEEVLAKNELSLNVILSYIEVLTCSDLLKLARLRQQTTSRQVERIDALNQSGAISPSDFFDLKGQFANDKLAETNADNQLQNAIFSLVKLMNIPYSEGLRFAVLNTDDFELNYADTVSEILQNGLSNFASVKIADSQRRSAYFKFKTDRAFLYPTITFNSGITSNYSNKAVDIQDKPLTYFEQFNNNLSKSFSLNLSIPVFHNFSKRTNKALAQLQQRQSDLIAESTRIQLQQLIRQAYFNMTASKERYLNSLEQVNAYKESYRANEIRFNAGAINATDYLISKNNLDRANIAVLTNRYDFIVRRKVLDFYQGKSLKQ